MMILQVGNLEMMQGRAGVGWAAAVGESLHRVYLKIDL
jgi:hypothetical protein